MEPVQATLPELKSAMEATNLLFKTEDPIGIAMTITAVLVVFCALILLYISFKYVGKIGQKIQSMQLKKASKTQEIAAPVVPAVAGNAAGEIYAAIAFAVYQYYKDMINREKRVITINKVPRFYSPWNSKLYGLREIPQKK